MSVLISSTKTLRWVLSSLILFGANFLSAQTEYSPEKDLAINASREVAFFPNVGQLHNDQGEVLEDVYFFLKKGM